MEEELPRALTYYQRKNFDGFGPFWIVDFDTDYTEYSLWKVIKKWQLENCEGEWDKDFNISSSGYASFKRKEDALLCFLRFT